MDDTQAHSFCGVYSFTVFDIFFGFFFLVSHEFTHCKLVLVTHCRGTAITMKKMLETQFPGIDVVLANYPPPLPKRLLAKVVPAVQIGVIGIIMAGEQIFPMLGIVTPPQWYYSLRANRFGSMASTWLLGNFLQSFLQSSGAFEVYCNDELVSDLSGFISLK